MEMVTCYMSVRYIPKREPLPFPQYLQKENKWYNDFWITIEGECIYPHQMNNRHLLNTVRMIHRSPIQLGVRYTMCNADEYILEGMAILHVVHDEIKKYNKNKKMRRRKPHKLRKIEDYCDMWTDYYLYMLLRREIKIRGLEEYL